MTHSSYGAPYTPLSFPFKTTLITLADEWKRKNKG